MLFHPDHPSFWSFFSLWIYRKYKSLTLKNMELSHNSCYLERLHIQNCKITMSQSGSLLMNLVALGSNGNSRAMPPALRVLGIVTWLCSVGSPCPCTRSCIFCLAMLPDLQWLGEGAAAPTACCQSWVWALLTGWEEETSSRAHSSICKMGHPHPLQRGCGTEWTLNRPSAKTGWASKRPAHLDTLSTRPPMRQFPGHLRATFLSSARWHV